LLIQPLRRTPTPLIGSCFGSLSNYLPLRRLSRTLESRWHLFRRSQLCPLHSTLRNAGYDCPSWRIATATTSMWPSLTYYRRRLRFAQIQGY
jgi:hypothetical protein